MRVSTLIAVLFATMATASVSRIATRDLEAQLFKAQAIDKRCICVGVFKVPSSLRATRLT
jgi:hypothetical protein